MKDPFGGRLPTTFGESQEKSHAMAADEFVLGRWWFKIAAVSDDSSRIVAIAATTQDYLETGSIRNRKRDGWMEAAAALANSRVADDLQELDLDAIPNFTFSKIDFALSPARRGCQTAYPQDGIYIFNVSRVLNDDRAHVTMWLVDLRMAFPCASNGCLTRDARLNFCAALCAPELRDLRASAMPHDDDSVSSIRGDDIDDDDPSAGEPTEADVEQRATRTMVGAAAAVFARESQENDIDSAFLPTNGGHVVVGFLRLRSRQLSCHVCRRVGPADAPYEIVRVHNPLHNSMLQGLPLSMMIRFAKGDEDCRLNADGEDAREFVLCSLPTFNAVRVRMQEVLCAAGVLVTAATAGFTPTPMDEFTGPVLKLELRRAGKDPQVATLALSQMCYLPHGARDPLAAQVPLPVKLKLSRGANQQTSELNPWKQKCTWESLPSLVFDDLRVPYFTCANADNEAVMTLVAKNFPGDDDNTPRSKITIRYSRSPGAQAGCRLFADRAEDYPEIVKRALAILNERNSLFNAIESQTDRLQRGRIHEIAFSQGCFTVKWSGTDSYQSIELHKHTNTVRPPAWRYAVMGTSEVYNLTKFTSSSSARNAAGHTADQPLQRYVASRVGMPDMNELANRNDENRYVYIQDLMQRALDEVAAAAENEAQPAAEDATQDGSQEDYQTIARNALTALLEGIRALETTARETPESRFVVSGAATLLLVSANNVIKEWYEHLDDARKAQVKASIWYNFSTVLRNEVAHNGLAIAPRQRKRMHPDSETQVRELKRPQLDQTTDGLITSSVWMIEQLGVAFLTPEQCGRVVAELCRICDPTAATAAFAADTMTMAHPRDTTWIVPDAAPGVRLRATIIRTDEERYRAIVDEASEGQPNGVPHVVPLCLKDVLPSERHIALRVASENLAAAVPVCFRASGEVRRGARCTCGLVHVDAFYASGLDALVDPPAADQFASHRALIFWNMLEPHQPHQMLETKERRLAVHRTSDVCESHYCGANASCPCPDVYFNAAQPNVPCQKLHLKREFVEALRMKLTHRGTAAERNQLQVIVFINAADDTDELVHELAEQGLSRPSAAEADPSQFDFAPWREFEKASTFTRIIAMHGEPRIAKVALVGLWGLYESQMNVTCHSFCEKLTAWATRLPAEYPRCVIEHGKQAAIDEEIASQTNPRQLKYNEILLHFCRGLPEAMVSLALRTYCVTELGGSSLRSDDVQRTVAELLGEHRTGNQADELSVPFELEKHANALWCGMINRLNPDPERNPSAAIIPLLNRDFAELRFFALRSIFLALLRQASSVGDTDFAKILFKTSFVIAVHRCYKHANAAFNRCSRGDDQRCRCREASGGPLCYGNFFAAARRLDHLREIAPELTVSRIHAALKAIYDLRNFDAHRATSPGAHSRGGFADEVCLLLETSTRTSDRAAHTLRLVSDSAHPCCPELDNLRNTTRPPGGVQCEAGCGIVLEDLAAALQHAAATVDCSQPCSNDWCLGTCGRTHAHEDGIDQAAEVTTGSRLGRVADGFSEAVYLLCGFLNKASADVTATPMLQRAVDNTFSSLFRNRNVSAIHENPYPCPKFWMGNCRDGSRCANSHDDKAVAAWRSSSVAKMRPCHLYQISLHCPLGENCPFFHSIDEIELKNLPVNFIMAYKTKKCVRADCHQNLCPFQHAGEMQPDAETMLRTQATMCPRHTSGRRCDIERNECHHAHTVAAMIESLRKLRAMKLEQIERDKLSAKAAQAERMRGAMQVTFASRDEYIDQLSSMLIGHAENVNRPDLKMRAHAVVQIQRQTSLRQAVELNFNMLLEEHLDMRPRRGDLVYTVADAYTVGDVCIGSVSEVRTDENDNLIVVAALPVNAADPVVPAAGAQVVFKVDDTIITRMNECLSALKTEEWAVPEPLCSDPKRTQVQVEYTSTVDRALGERLTLIHGPPGTGKTTTLAEIVVRAVSEGMFVVATGSSNTAVDNLALATLAKLAHNGADDHSVLVRWISQNAGDLDYVSSCWAAAEGSGGRLAVKMTHQLQGTNPSSLKAVFVTCVSVGNNNVRQLIETARERARGTGRKVLVLLDEATQCPELESLIPIAHARPDHVVLAGDHMQLGVKVDPTIEHQSMRSRWTRSLFERLIEAGYHRELLTEQRRMHPVLWRFSNVEFYSGQVRAAQPRGVRGRRVPLACFTSQNCPLSFFHCKTSRTDETNEDEAEVVLAVVRCLSNAGIEHKNIGVICSYRSQVLLIKGLLAETENAPGVEVGTVDGFQGREKDYIIYSVVSFQRQDPRRARMAGIGFTGDPRRVNVSLTRARLGLCVTGNCSKLRDHSRVWARFLSYTGSIQYDGTVFSAEGKLVRYAGT